MLKNLHLVGENEDDDLYSEFKEVDNEVGKDLFFILSTIEVCAHPLKPNARLKFMYIHLYARVDLKLIAICMLKCLPYVLLLRLPLCSILH